MIRSAGWDVHFSETYALGGLRGSAGPFLLNLVQIRRLAKVSGNSHRQGPWLVLGRMR